MRPIPAALLGLHAPMRGGSPARPAAGAAHKPKMNRTEAAYAAQLEFGVRSGSVLWWAFEGVTLKLADDTRYTPDFAVQAADGVLEMHETKGFMRDDARVKLKVAARLFPMRFYLVRAIDKGAAWDIEYVKP